MGELDEWDYLLPEGCIARVPALERSGSRLMHLPLSGGEPTDHAFGEVLSFLRLGDLLVGNDTRVMSARLRATRATGGALEILLLEPGPGVVQALLKPARRLREGERVNLVGGGTVVVHGRAKDEGVFRIEFDADPIQVMASQGEIPLPPYLERQATSEDAERYQTVYAGPLGAAAAPTAGLHFSTELFARLKERGIGFETLTLHVGIGTFRPVKAEDLAVGRLHEERYSISPALVEAIRRTREKGGRVVAIGTTTVRALESATPNGDRIPVSGASTTNILIRPPYSLRAVDGLITNFHLPRSSLLMLVGAMVGRERLLSTYRSAVERGYRFYSYGDAMLLI